MVGDQDTFASGFLEKTAKACLAGCMNPESIIGHVAADRGDGATKLQAEPNGFLEMAIGGWAGRC